MKSPAHLLPLLLPAALLAATPTLLADTFTPGTSTYTAATTGVYALTVAGAAGGGEAAIHQYGGGSGLVLSADFSLTAGTVLTIGVGAQGRSDTFDGDGGGGSFVQILNALNPLLDAGGGGGASVSGSGGSAQTGPDGQSISVSSGGTGGQDGQSLQARGGGGFFGSGSTLGGSRGGNSGGGGGGYSGGAGGVSAFQGGGGGSYSDNADLIGSLTTAYNTGNGYASITLVQATAITPEPSSLLLLGTGILGLAGAIRRRLSA